MWFRYDVNDLSRNPKVYKADERKITLTTDFRIELFKLWRNGDPEGVQRALDENDLGIDKTGGNYLETLITSFKSGGYPVYKSAELELKSGFQEDNPLILSGKFKRDGGKRQGLNIDPGFEQWLFARYPELSVEEGLKAAGLDPVDVGYNRIHRLKKTFEERAKRLYKSSPDVVSGADIDDEYIDVERGNTANCNPYISDIHGDAIELSDAFYNESYLLVTIGVDKLFEAYEFERDWFNGRNRIIIQSKLARWEPLEMTDAPWSEQVLRIQRNRYYLLSRSVADGFETIKEVLPVLPVEKRRDLASWIHGLPPDPHGFYTTRRVLEKIGMSKSVYYELLNNERYGMSIQRKEARDAEDIGVVRQVIEYKGFAKGIRQIYMLMPHVTGKQFSIHRIRRLMKKDGIETAIRRPSKNRKAMKELIERNRKSNLLLRRFRLHRPNEVRLTDVTYLDYGDGKRAYGSASIDPATGRLICFVISRNNDLQLALGTLEEMDKYPAKRGAIFHPDQGILYLTDDFQAAVSEREPDQSMSRRGNCWDNAPQEAFFGHFKDESGYEKCQNLKELRDTVKRYAVYYNEERKIWERGRMAPVEYEAWLNDMSETEFTAYLETEEEKYKKTKEESAKKAIKRAREYREDTLASMEERNETCKA